MRFKLKFLLLLFLGIFLSTTGVAYLQETEAFKKNLSSKCRNQIESSRDLSPDCRSELQEELGRISNEIDEQNKVLSDIQRERTYIERDIDVIEVNIRKEELGIRARDIEIYNLDNSISNKEKDLDSILEEIIEKQKILSSVIQKINEIEKKSLTFILLSENTVSDFFTRISDYESLQNSINKSFVELDILRRRLIQEQENLISQKEEQQFLKGVQVDRKKEIERDRKVKEVLLEEKLGAEVEKETEIKNQRAIATEIRNALFRLRDAGPIPFSEALAYARRAEAETGVRAAFILGVITQETKLGANVGTGNWRTDMHPTRDRPLFAAITKELGLNPNDAPVSKRPGYGWGGAMGPAQFIPSTWACFGGFINRNTRTCNNKRGIDAEVFWAGPWEYRSSQDRIRAILGSSTISNPWNPEVAFMASALLLRENGAARGGYTNEHKAARVYFAGPVGARNPAYYFYGDGVMKFAADYERKISILR